VNILRDSSFLAENPVPPLRALYELVAPAVDQLIYKEWKQRKCFILTTEVASAIIRRWYASLHWTKENGSIPGRKLNERKFLKLLYGFWSVDIHGPISVPILRQLSGRAARYQTILRPPKMLTSKKFAGQLLIFQDINHSIV
jgi:hypothetical protein